MLPRSRASAAPSHTARVKQAARDQGREVRTLINPMMVCRETEAEAKAYHDAIIDHADAASPLGFQTFDSDAHAWRGRQGRDLPTHRALGGNIQIIGSPEQVVQHILRLHAAGIDGIQLSFFDFLPDLEFFGEWVLPLLKQAGLRR
jgi:FMNH2-dependent dimethyl sulfone monooxygenase